MPPQVTTPREKNWGCPPHTDRSPWAWQPADDIALGGSHVMEITGKGPGHPGSHTAESPSPQVGDPGEIGPHPH